jgi:hypothetical protein
MEQQWKIGDLVVLDELYATSVTRGVVYRVSDILKVNIVVQPVSGGRGLRGKPYQFQAAPKDAATAAIGVPYVPPVWPGEVVTIAGPGWKQPSEVLWVVIKDNADRKVKVARLGGDAGRYWTVPRGMLTVVDKSVILEAVLAAEVMVR